MGFSSGSAYLFRVRTLRRRVNREDTMRAIVTFAVALVAVFPAGAETVTLQGARDATLIEDPAGARANGSGPFFFVGRTAGSQNAVRRSVFFFDVAATVPERAIIQSVSLTVFLWPSHPEVREIRLHRVLAAWGEGPSSSSGGGGVPSEAGDVTWLHTLYDTEPWVRAGGQFVARASARLEVADTAYYTWEPTDHLVQDVRLWHAAPQRNFGWMLIGDETTPQSVKSFASREHPDLNLRPTLTVTYRMPGRP